jgi:hypothetical protein
VFEQEGVRQVFDIQVRESRSTIGAEDVAVNVLSGLGQAEPTGGGGCSIITVAAILGISFQLLPEYVIDILLPFIHYRLSTWISLEEGLIAEVVIVVMAEENVRDLTAESKGVLTCKR